MAEAGKVDYLVYGDKRGVLALQEHGMKQIISAVELLEVTAFFNQGERIAHPVGAFGFHHVGVRKQKHRCPTFIGAGQLCDQSTLVGELRHGKDVDVNVGLARGFESCGH